VAILAVAAALACLGIAGEEISWGQRLVGWTTPEALGGVNVQDETNLHNIGALESLVRAGQVAAAGYAVLAPLVALALVDTLRPLGRFLVPPLALETYFIPLLAYWLIRLPIEPTETISRFSEVPELTFYLGVALVAALNLRRLKAPRPSP
jgi:hypothetical protein